MRRLRRQLGAEDGEREGTAKKGKGYEIDGWAVVGDQVDGDEREGREREEGLGERRGRRRGALCELLKGF